MLNGGINTTQVAAGAITEGKLTLADVSTGDVSTSRHGFAPKVPGDSTRFLDGTGAYSTPSSNAASLQPNAAAISASLYGWYKADAGVYKDGGITLAVDGDTIQQWNDQSGNGRHLTQATAGKRPTYKTGILNGLPVTRWAGAQCLQGTAFAIGTFTILIIFKASGTPGIFYELSASTASNDGIQLFGSNSDSSQVKKGGVLTSRTFAGNWAVVNCFGILAHWYNGSHATHNLLSGGLMQFTSTGVGGSGDPGTAITTDTFNLGSRNNAASAAITGDISEVVIYTPSISNQNMRGVLQYGQNKWNL